MALMALSNIGVYTEIEKEAYLKEMTEIIEYHQKHHNLTQLAYQSAWQFLVNRFYKDKSLENLIANGLHFVREASRELKEFSKRVNLKGKRGEEGGKMTLEELTLMRWLNVIDSFFFNCRLWNEELVELISSIVQMFRASRDSNRTICNRSISLLRVAAYNRNVKIDDLLKSGAIDAILEEMKQSTSDDFILCNGLYFFLIISESLKEEDDEDEKVKRKATKRKIFEMMEEEGYEDALTSFYETLQFFGRKYSEKLPLNIFDYFVNV
ncbi:uncharacterized protein MONOS_6238 [Monocercomonoides exilis]|uniref:uncharacterized protein n=1 Tax=Monocercomonoides exilis TaxID=2049356 RepID=UPI00355956B1|nr:hypothetical protein MONOS_6238 [Monocercomonoides exilis]|eukprot:MONOS_6238.1-p1 / transcript=MONOS_6238.1 / gene=MONOS_6238 / organism=Monocercomonoides_exilis_PA203 / gene_product=unspecified product / transcript_product=unspecified product / location=Mono_scaffold00194:4444-5308(+) / protein_length=267 / sequence_SO=supercontig / SO=protein_coding / is_pseudo=false